MTFVHLPPWKQSEVTHESQRQIVNKVNSGAPKNQAKITQNFI